ncbi:MAG: class I SAM-dependent methyltransferase, partial [Candidatus Viridilinea halotolerans]
SCLFTEIFAATGATLVAVDISGEILNLARGRNLPTQQVTFLEKRFEECDVEGPFDAIIGSSILHHLEVEASLVRIFEMLKPGGLISFAEPNMLNPQILVQKNIPLVKRMLGDSPDETAFVRWQMAKQLTSVGFEDVSVTPHDWLHPATPRPLIPAVRKLGFWLEVTPGLRELAGSVFIRAKRPV